MPRDAAPIEDGIVDLPGRRRGRVIPGDVAGSFRVELIGSTLLDRLADVAWLSRDQHEAGEVLRALFEQSRVQPRIGASYQGFVDGTSVEFGLERMTERETAAWRRLSRLLRAVPSECRSSVEAVCCWDTAPASLRQLQVGLQAVAAALRAPRRRRP